MKFIIHGALGRMGQAVEKFLIEENPFIQQKYDVASFFQFGK